MKALADSRVCVVGLGGVGSHTVSMLARSGVGHIRMIDFDQVTLSSLNRHACATLEDVGIPKATCLSRYCRRVCPDPRRLDLEPVVAMYTADTGPELLSLASASSNGTKWDLVIDAIDDVPTKAALLTHCLQHQIPVVSCMGAGGKSDPTRLKLSDLRTAACDPLATKLRNQLKKKWKKKNKSNNQTGGDDEMAFLDDMDALTVLSNSEKTVAKLADLTPAQQAAGAHEFGAVDGMRVRVLPVLGTTPAMMGQALAAVAVTRLGQKPIAMPEAAERVGRNVRNKLLQHLSTRERGIEQRVLEEAGLEAMPEATSVHDVSKGAYINPTSWVGPVQLDADDIDYSLQAWRNRCAITTSRIGAVLRLVRWDLSKPSTIDNLVLVAKHTMEKYDKVGWDQVPSKDRERIEARLRAMSILDEM